MFEVDLIGLLQSAVQVLQLVVQFHLLLHQTTHTHQHILDRPLTIDLLDLHTTEIFQLLQVSGTFVDATAKIINAGLWRKEEDHIGGDLERFHYDFIQCGMKIGH